MTIHQIITKRIKDGSLPKRYKKDIPKKSLSVDNNQDAVFIPRGMSWDEWDILLKKTCNGLWKSGYSNKKFEGSGWDTALVSNTPKPTEVNITYDESIAQYKQLLSIEGYLAFQWLRLEKGLEPADRGTSSWLQQEDYYEIRGGPYAYWVPGDGQVVVLWLGPGDQVDDLGVRPAVGEERFDARSFLGSLPSAAGALGTEGQMTGMAASIEDNTKALNRLTDKLDRIFKS